LVPALGAAVAAARPGGHLVRRLRAEGVGALDRDVDAHLARALEREDQRVGQARLHVLAESGEHDVADAALLGGRLLDGGGRVAGGGLLGRGGPGCGGLGGGGPGGGCLRGLCRRLRGGHGARAGGLLAATRGSTWAPEFAMTICSGALPPAG